MAVHERLINYIFHIKPQKPTSGYGTFSELHEAMDAKKINGCLIDSYVAAYYASKFQHFRVNNVISSSKVS